MSGLITIGKPPWSREDITASIDEFSDLYAKRPIKDNQGGMKAPHMFAVWFMARKLNPDLIVESGVWKGQSTWLLEQACPNSRLICIDIDLKHRTYISKTATYSDREFCEHDWPSLSVSDRSLVFFDDHQNAYVRLQQCKWFGFRHIIFEDNYPVTQGNCYSLKKVFANAGFEPANSQQRTSNIGFADNFRRRLAKVLRISPITPTLQYSRTKIAPNKIDSQLLREQLDVYYEFPPVFKTAKTRWGDDWSESSYPTPEPLLDRVTKSTHKVFFDEAEFYTWICYAKLHAG